MSVDASDITDSQMNESASDDVRDLKRRLEEVEKENRRLKQLSEKRQRRAPKKTVKGENFKPLKEIQEKDRLTHTNMYVVGQTIRTHLFRNMKYFIEVYQKSALEHASRLLNFDENDKIKYTDYVLHYIDKKITAHRNNIIHALKRLVLGLDGGKSRQMNMASIHTNTGTNRSQRCVLGVDKLELPKEYKSWKDAIGDFVEARGNNKTPDQLDAHTWKAFETFAIKLAPKVSVYVHSTGAMTFRDYRNLTYANISGIIKVRMIR